MVQENRFISKNLENKVRRKIFDDSDSFNCKEVKPKNSKLVGQGEARCVFERDDSIIKIARGHEGIAQNSSVYHIIDDIEESRDSFALPLDGIEGIAIKQEKVTPYEETVKQSKVRKINRSQAEPIKEGTDREKMYKQMKKASQKDGIQCDDWQNPYNWGVKNNELVLVDLGECKK